MLFRSKEQSYEEFMEPKKIVDIAREYHDLLKAYSNFCSDPRNTNGSSEMVRRIEVFTKLAPREVVEDLFPGGELDRIKEFAQDVYRATTTSSLKRLIEQQQ